MATFAKFVWVPLVLVVLFLFLPEEMTLFVQGLIFISFVIAIFAGFQAVGYLREKKLSVKDERKYKEMQARFIVNQHGVWGIAHPDWEIVRLTDTPFIRNNGHDRALTDDEYRYLLTKNSPKVIEAVPQLVSGEVKQLDLLTVFTQPTQSYAIIGGQQTGKTFQAQHIANYWIDKNCKPLVIGPKWDKGEWSGCYLMGGNGDYQKVSTGIQRVRELAKKRHADTNTKHKDHPIQPIFFDDWTAVVQNSPDAIELILDATVLYASVNIVLYFIIHLDTANAWGVNKVGAALKNNFIKLKIVPTYDENGMIVRNQTRGYVRFAGEDVDRPVSLINSSLVKRSEGVVVNTKAAKRILSKEDRIIELIEKGLSNKDIGLKLFNKYPTGNDLYIIKRLREQCQ